LTQVADLSFARTLGVNENAGLHIRDLGGSLRVAERVVLGFFTFASIASVIVPLSLHQRLLLLGLNLVTGALIIMAAKISKPSRLVQTIRDWSPAVLILVAYRESGLFFKPDPTHHLDYLLVRWDWMLLHNQFAQALFSLSAPWLQRYLELAYLLCYPLVPLGFAALVFAPSVGEPSGLPRALGRLVRGREREALPYQGLPATLVERRPSVAIDHFWTTVLLATLTCYAFYPFFPLTPPRTFFHDLPGPAVEPLLRKANFWILDRYSVQACIFPSGHVAAVTAVALVIRSYQPRLGVLFMAAALSVTAATVYGRYHYAGDAVAGALVGLAAYFISTRIRR
jgi:membrane-associated phospholipid phosphatase